MPWPEPLDLALPYPGLSTLSKHRSQILQFKFLVFTCLQLQMGKAPLCCKKQASPTNVVMLHSKVLGEAAKQKEAAWVVQSIVVLHEHAD